MKDRLARFFRFEDKGATLQTELTAGLTTFLTMAYIIVVNPAILSETGMPFAGVLLATVLLAAGSSILMGFVANLPFAMAPGMGINAFFTYTLVLGMGIAWQTALGAVFVSGVIFLALSLMGVRERIVAAIPAPVRYGVAAGIGLFLALIGLQSVDFIVSDPVTVVTFGGLTAQIGVFAAGLAATTWMVIRRIRGALVFGIVGTSVIALLVSAAAESLGYAPFADTPDAVFAWPDASVLFALDIRGALALGMIMPIFTFLFTDIFDSLSTFVGISEVGGFIDKKTGQPENVGRALLADAISTVASGLLGTSSGTTYIESAAGIEEGGRTGLTAIVAGLLFLPFMFLSPLLALVPEVATAPVLVLVGLFMMQPLSRVRWNDFEDALPAFLAVILIPLTYNITQGIIWAFLAHTAIKLLLGKWRELTVTLIIIDILAIISLVYGAE